MSWLETAEESTGRGSGEAASLSYPEQPSSQKYISVIRIFVQNSHSKRVRFCLHLLGELPTDPGGSIEHLADAISLGVAGDEVSVVQQHGHLRNGKLPDSFNSDRYI